jgi:hypothetical protein
MKAAIFEKPGLENLKVIDNAEEPKVSDHDILIRVKATGVIVNLNRDKYLYLNHSCKLKSYQCKSKKP